MRAKSAKTRGSIRRRRRLLAAFLFAAQASGCGPQHEESAASPPAPLAAEATQTAVVLDLTADLPSAQRERPTLGFALEAAEFGRLSAGWHRPEEFPKGHRFAWTRGRDSVVTFFLVEPQDRRLILDLEPLIAKSAQPLPRQNVRVLWNGQPIETLSLDRERRTAEIVLPAALQVHGPNRLDLLPLYWVQPLAVGAAFELREVGIKLNSLRLEGGVPEAADASPPARFADGAILQEPGSVLTWAYALPRAARLRGQARLEVGPEVNTALTRGRVTLSLRRRAGPERVLLSRSLAELSRQPELEIDAELGPGEDAESDFASLSASFSLPADLTAGLPPEAWPRLQWRGLRIEGSEAEAPRDIAVKRDRYNVLFVLFDTLRADFTSAYGSQVTKTPELDRLAASGVRFRDTRANASWTLASVASLLTGLQPGTHGILNHDARLAGGTPYLPALLEAAGYRTLGISNNAYNSAAFGFERGYAQLHPYYEERERVRLELTTPEAQAEQVWQRFIAPALKDAEAAGAPLFTLLHEIDPHSPYQPPSPFSERHDFGYQGNLDGWISGNLTQGMAMLHAVNDLPRWLQETDLRYLRSRYAGEVEFMDAYLGWLLDRLEAQGLREKTLVVFVSDHGEQFMEHGSWGHGRSVYDEELRVPLLFSLPGVLPAEGQPGVAAQGVDVTPTILDLLGLSRPESMQGESLLPWMLAEAADSSPRANYARSNLRILPNATEAEEWHSVRLGRWKLLRQQLTRLGQPFFQYELYDLEADPAESVDRWPAEPVVGDALRQLLAIQESRDGAARQQEAAPAELDPEARENLRALGYVE